MHSRSRKGTTSHERSDFVGDRLRLARALRGYSQKQLAELVTADASAISKIEAGKLDPSENLLLAFCEALDFDAEFFTRPVADEYKMHECSFRHLQSTSKRLFEQVLARGSLLQEAVSRINEAVELPQPNVPEIPARDVGEIELAAEKCREIWGLGLRAPIASMIRVAEHAGVVVTRLDGTTERVDAFSRYGSPPMIVLASMKECSSRDRFNVAHELAHLVIHRGHPTGDIKTEREANRFAAALLAPREVFADEFRCLPRIEWPHLFELKRRWKMAAAAVLHRATELNLVDVLKARRLYKQYSSKGWQKGEPYEVAAEQPELLTLAIEAMGLEANHEKLLVGLGWRPRTALSIAGLSIPSTEPPLDENVKPFTPRRISPS